MGIKKDAINFIEAILLCDNISSLYVPSYTTIYIKITQSRVTGRPKHVAIKL